MSTNDDSGFRHQCSLGSFSGFKAWWIAAFGLVLHGVAQALTVATYNIENYTLANRMVEGVYREAMVADFRAVSGRELVSVRLDHKRRRQATIFVGEDFSPRPRSLSGPPTPP